MTSLTTEQLTELTERFNERLDEFGGDFGHWTPGFMRLAHDVIEEWQDEQSLPARADDGDSDDELLTIAYGVGYERGKQVNAPADSTPRLVTNSAPEPAPSVAVPPEAPPKSDEKLTNGYHPVTTALADEQATPRVSPQAAAALGPEHTVVTPLKPPDPDIARANLAAAVATGHAQLGTTQRTPLTKPRTLAEVDAIEDDLDDDDEEDELPTKRVRPNGKRKPSPRKMGYEKAQRVDGRKFTTQLPAMEEVVKELQRQSMAGVMPTQAQFDLARPATWATSQAHLKRFELTWESLAKEAGLTLKRPK